MSDATPIQGIVLSHGDMAAGLTSAVRLIAGADEDALVPVSNQGVSPDVVVERIRELAGERPTILFTDLQSGSCAFAGRRLCHERADFVVISGVNLPMLLEFVLRRDVPLAKLVPLLLEKGRAAIACAPGELGRDADRAVSSG
ncbi:MAG TPA: hypothetical protein VNZ57_02235 [Longimicrobiales bacterium]|nr:hypothetical protein [Longimicrobiales bacterium]